MWGYEDEAQKDQKLVDEGEMPAPKEKKIGLVWSTHGLIWFMESGIHEKRYVGALRLKKKTLSPDVFKRLSKGARIIMEYNAEAIDEKNLD